MELFDFISTTLNIWGKSKSLGKVKKKQKLKFENVLYVGDETRDIEAARKVGIKVASVRWGHNSKEILIEFQPDYLITRPEELTETIC